MNFHNTIDTNGEFPVARLFGIPSAGVTATPAGAFVFDTHADTQAMLDAMACMEGRALTQETAERLRLSSYLVHVAAALMAPEPHIHITVERFDHPHTPMAVIKVTRLLYREGHPANDDATQTALFRP